MKTVMGSHRPLFKRLVLLPLLLVMLLFTGASFADGTQKLFFIQRSKNANEVHYDARVKGEALDSDDPIDAYWLNKATDGKREGISFLEKVAYGYDIDPVKDGAYHMKLSAFPDRLIVVRKVGGKWRAHTTIAGAQAFLDHLYVATDESGVMPTVLYVDLFGIDGAGKPVTERLKK